MYNIEYDLFPESYFKILDENFEETEKNLKYYVNKQRLIFKEPEFVKFKLTKKAEKIQEYPVLVDKFFFKEIQKDCKSFVREPLDNVDINLPHPFGCDMSKVKMDIYTFDEFKKHFFIGREGCALRKLFPRGVIIEENIFGWIVMFLEKI